MSSNGNPLRDYVKQKPVSYSTMKQTNKMEMCIHQFPTFGGSGLLLRILTPCYFLYSLPLSSLSLPLKKTLTQKDKWFRSLALAWDVFKFATNAQDGLNSRPLV